MEAVTDKNGRFYFPAWGPTEIPSRYPAEARLMNQDPAIMILKIGYATKGLTNELRGPMVDHGPTLRESMWHGKTIELRKFEGDRKAHALSLGLFASGFSLDKCGWTKIPKTMAALVRTADEFSKDGLIFGPPTIKDIEGMSEREPCAGTAKELLGIQ